MRRMILERLRSEYRDMWLEHSRNSLDFPGWIYRNDLNSFPLLTILQGVWLEQRCPNTRSSSR